MVWDQTDNYPSMRSFWESLYRYDIYQIKLRMWAERDCLFRCQKNFSFGRRNNFYNQKYARIRRIKNMSWARHGGDAFNSSAGVVGVEGVECRDMQISVS